MLLPMTAMAADHSSSTRVTENTVLIEASGEYYLSEDVALNGPMVITGNGVQVSLCLNGYDLTLSDKVEDQVIYVEKGASLTIQDCNEDNAHGTRYGYWSGDEYRITSVKPEGKIHDVLEGGIISGGRGKAGDSTNNGGSGNINIENSTFVLEGGEIAATDQANGFGVRNNNIMYLSGDPVLRGGQADVFLTEGQTITVRDAMNNASPFRVRIGTSGVTGQFAKPDTNYTITVEDRISFQSAVNEYMVVQNNDGSLSLVERPVPELDTSGAIPKIYANGVALILTAGTRTTNEGEPYTVIYIDNDRDGAYDPDTDSLWVPGGIYLDNTLAGNDLTDFCINGGSKNGVALASDVTIHMLGGQVSYIYGANVNCQVGGNVDVIMSGGTVGSVFGAEFGVEGDVNVTMTGGTVTTAIGAVNVYVDYAGSYKYPEVGGEKALTIGGNAVIDGENVTGVMVTTGVGEVTPFIIAPNLNSSAKVTVHLPADMQDGTVIATEATRGDLASIFVAGPGSSGRAVFLEGEDIKVFIADYTITAEAPTFASVNYGYPQPAAQRILITSLGNASATIKSAEVSDPTSFIIGGTGETVPAGGGISRWTVRPNADLGVGFYSGDITVTYNDDAIAVTTVNFTVNPAPQDVPPTPPQLSSRTEDSITLKLVVDSPAGAKPEYSNDGGQTWQEESAFTDLTPDTEYQFAVRYAATADGNYGPSNPSAIVPFSTDSKIKLIEGNGSQCSNNTAYSLLFVSNDEFDNFLEVKVDREVIEEDKDFVAEKGSIEITLKPEFLNTLSPGEHSIDILSSEGTASGIFYITPAANISTPEPVPGTPSQNPGGTTSQNPDGTTSQNPGGTASQNPGGTASNNPGGNAGTGDGANLGGTGGTGTGGTGTGGGTSLNGTTVGTGTTGGDGDGHTSGSLSTGDTINILFYVGIGVAALVSLVVIVVCVRSSRKKRSK